MAQFFMSTTRATGLKGEEEAVQFLHANGYTVVERNWRWHRAEIDIIAKKGNELIFVEVKTRKNDDFGYPEEFVTEDQEERIHLAADAYCEQMNFDGKTRFDIISISLSSFPNHLEHLEDAF